MNVKIKNFTVNMDVKTSGIEFQVNDTDGSHLGDLYLTKTGMIWCEGRTRRENGKKIRWRPFAEYMQSK